MQNGLMHGFGFQTLALLTAVGFAGPLLAAVPRLRIPVLIGELIAGIIIGKTGFGVVDINDPMFALLANIGFALVMFVVGTHVPVRDPKMRAAVPMALARAVLAGAVAAALLASARRALVDLADRSSETGRLSSTTVMWLVRRRIRNARPWARGRMRLAVGPSSA